MASQEPQIHRALRADVHEISAMIQELADFEKESASNKATPEKLLETVNFADDVAPEHIPGFLSLPPEPQGGALLRLDHRGQGRGYGALLLQL